LKEVNKVWAGLGYYARANRLLQSAKLIVEKFNGEFPRDAKSLEKEIPGVGKYTAGLYIISFVNIINIYYKWL